MYNEADVLFVIKKKSLLAKAIRWFTRKPSEGKTKANHVAMYIYPDNVIEALKEVKVNTKKYWVDNTKHFEVWRTDLTDQQRSNIKDEVLKYKGKRYGYFKMITQALDGLLSKFFDKDVFIFRKLHFTNYPICSWLIAKVYWVVCGYQFSVKYEYANPDDMRDHVSNNPSWRLIKSN